MSPSQSDGPWSAMLAKRVVLLGLIGLGSLIAASAQTTVFNCSSFAATGACATAKSGYTGNFLVRNGGDLSGSVIDFVPANSGHNGYGLTYYVPVSVESFVTTFTFIPNGQNIAFVVQNSTTNPGYTGNIFSSGAGCEGGFYQAFGTAPNNIFAMELSSESWLTEASAAFTYSSVQIYQTNQSPCLPNDNGPDFVPISKISTYPVPLNAPANARWTTTGDVYSATVSYDGSTLSLSMHDVTAGGSCPGSSCFTQSWTGVNIPSIVAGSTAYVGFTAGINIPNLPALWVDSWSFTYGTSTQAATPTISPVAGSYANIQSVTLASASAGATIYYTTDGTIPTTSSTRYTAPITVSSTETLKAIAAAVGDTDSAVATALYNINLTLPSAATPTFSLPAGSYNSAQSVTISDATADATVYYTTNGTTPTTSSTEYTGPITVSSTKTIQAIAVATGDSNSEIATAVYTINSVLPSAAIPTFSPAGGAYTSAQSVALSDATSGATIYYTTDGSVPTTTSTLYAGAINVSSTETLEAIAVATGDSNSSVASMVYTISASLPSVATPTFSPAAGTYSAAQSVTLSDATAGATIYYTIDGTKPTTSSTAYTGPVAVSATETLEAIAAASNDSAVASAVYTITAQPNFMLGTSVNSLAINSGSQGTVMVTVTPENGFSSPVVLACAGLPTWATCSFGESTVTPSGAPATTQLIISTSSQSAGLSCVTALAMTLGLFGWRKRRGWSHWLLVAVAYGAFGLLCGCSTTGATGGASSAHTTSTVTVTAISGTLQGSAAIAITLN